MDSSAGNQASKAPHAGPPFGSTHDTSLERELAHATATCALAVVAGMAAEALLGFDDLSLVLMTAVIAVSVRSRLGVSVFAAVICFLAYNFFFLEPRYTFYIEARQGLATVVLFLASALICGRLANRLRDQVLLLQAARLHAEALRQLGRRLMAAASEDDALAAATTALGEALETEAVVLLWNEAAAKLQERRDGADRFDPSLHAAATAAWSRASRRDDAAALPADHDIAWHCFVLGVPGHPIGVVALRLPTAPSALPPEQARLAEAMVRDLGQALARLRLGRQLAATQLQAETERLRAALLTSVSHDLRSPLSTIIGSAESLDVLRDRLTPADQRQLARDILDEGRRLDRYIQNLLDMTRLGPGAPAPQREWIGLDDVVGTAVQRVLRIHPGREVSMRLQADAPLLHVHPALFGQALFNVLDNAAKFSPPSTPIELAAAVEGSVACIEVRDHGPGIPPHEREAVFDMFHSVARGDRRTNGSGLGLTICRAILRAHGGEATALPAEPGPGTVLRLCLPLEPTPPDLPKDD